MKMTNKIMPLILAAGTFAVCLVCLAAASFYFPILLRQFLLMCSAVLLVVIPTFSVYYKAKDYMKRMEGEKGRKMETNREKIH